MNKSGKIPKIVKSNFSPAFLLLEKEKRYELSIIYSFARTIDDIADDISLTEIEKEYLLNQWKDRINEIFLDKNLSDDLSIKLNLIIRKYNIDKNIFIELINGVYSDIKEVRYNTFEELKKYMYRVAVIPGLITLDILEYKGKYKQILAENLGYAVQLTNIMRDIYKDADIDRFYIPLEDMKKFNVLSDDIKAKKISNDFYKMMLFEYKRTKDFYEKALEILFLEKNKLKLPLAMAMIYEKLLEKIKKKDFDMRKKIPKINKLEGIVIILKLL